MSELQSQQYVSVGGPGFPTFLDLRSSHNVLLRRQRETELIHLRHDVEGFIGRARATGAILDAESHRDAAQALIDYWTTALYRAEVDAEPIALEDFNPMLVPMLRDEACPYVGLEAFREADGDFFFGRRRLVQVLLDRLHTNKFVAVLGQSGSGKSSVVMGGLLPATRRGEIDGSESWKLYPPIVPGSDPLRALAAFFVDDDLDAEAALFRRDPNHLATRLDQAGVPGIVVVDQFEELFTLCDDPGARDALSANVAAVVQRPNNPHTIVVTMRSDYELYLPKLPLLQPLFEAGEVRITPLNAAELREAIERPASLVGLKFDEGLVDALVRDTLGEPAALPLLQFTLLQLWDQRERNRLTMAAYRRLGGSRGALEKTADAVLSSLLYQDQQIAKRILLRIVRFSPGVELMRNRIREAELYRLGDNREAITRVLERFVQARLIRRTQGKTDADTQIEVAHESLVRNWPTLVGWLEQGKANLATLRHYEKLATDWIGFNRESGFLDAAQITEAQRWMSTSEAREIGISSSVVELVEASRAKIEQEELTRRRWRLLRNFAIAALIVVTVVALGAIGFSLRTQRNVAREQSMRAEAERRLIEFRNTESRRQLAEQERETERQRQVARTINEQKEQIQKQYDQLADQRNALVQKQAQLVGALAEVKAQRDQVELLSEIRAALLAESEENRKELQKEMDERLTAEAGLRLYEEQVAESASFEAESKDGKSFSVIAAPDAIDLHTKKRPVHPGLSVGGVSAQDMFAGTGTLSCFVVDATGDRYILSLATIFGMEEGTSIIQPGEDDGGTSADQIGVLTRRGADEFRSAAIAKLLPGIEVDPTIAQISTINDIAVAPPTKGDRVRFIGRGSGVVETSVGAVDPDGDIVLPLSSNPGDAGAPVFNEHGQLIGLLWGSLGKVTWVIPIEPLFKEVGVTLAPPETWQAAPHTSSYR